MINNFVGKKIVVFGVGVSGHSAIKILSRLGVNLYAINKGPVESLYLNADQYASENSDKAYLLMDTCDLVILSPGIPREHPLLLKVHERKIPIWGEIELAYQLLKDNRALIPMIGITGTNGKTTTTTFLQEMLIDQGKNPFVGGNIGLPFCEIIEDIFFKKINYDVIVLELSSFQCESIDEFHVDIALILNVFQNHGERYESMADYAHAKFQIIKNSSESDWLIYPEDFELIATWAKKQNLQKRTINTQNVSLDFDLSAYKLKGQHNRVNLAFLAEVAFLLKFNHALVQKTIDRFTGVHFRIEYVATKEKFQAYNDAKSTNWDATLTAIHAVKDETLLYVIIGGKKRGHGDSILPHLAFFKNMCARIYTIGEMSFFIKEEVGDDEQFVYKHTLDEVLFDIKAQSFAGTVLFSPAFPSFDQFKNYEERGALFQQLLL